MRCMNHACRHWPTNVSILYIITFPQGGRGTRIERNPEAARAVIAVTKERLMTPAFREIPRAVMSLVKIPRKEVALLLACVAFMPVHAETDTTNATGDWEWSATLYLWLPSLDGTTAFPPSDGGPDMSVDMESFLDKLNSVFMGALAVRNGPWGLAADVIYLDLEANRNATREFGLAGVDIPSTISANLELGLTGWLWSLDGSYAILQRDKLSMSILAGARMLDLQEDLHYTFNGDISALPVIGRTGSAQAQQTQWDAIAGLKGQASLGAERQWYVPYYLDAGAGESNFTWQAMVGLGYSFGAVDVLGVWRYLDYDLGDGIPIRSIEFNGPAVGFTFRF
jgi:hypothetical protein